MKQKRRTKKNDGESDSQLKRIRVNIDEITFNRLNVFCFLNDTEVSDVCSSVITKYVNDYFSKHKGRILEMLEFGDKADSVDKDSNSE